MQKLKLTKIEAIGLAFYMRFARSKAKQYINNILLSRVGGS